METIEQGLRRIFKNAPHIYAECVRCAKERPNMDWGKTYGSPISGSHKWGIYSYADSSGKYWEELDRKANAGEQIGPDYPLPPDSPIRQKEVGNWYMCVNGYKNNFITKGWYKCIKPTNKLNSFIDNKGERNGWRRFNHEHFDLSNPLPHNPETKPTLEDIETKPEQAPELTQKTEIKLHEERFTFSRNYCTVVLQVFYTQNNYKVYQPKIDDVDQDNHETLLELQLEAVRFAKKRLLESSGNYSNN